MGIWWIELLGLEGILGFIENIFHGSFVENYEYLDIFTSDLGSEVCVTSKDTNKYRLSYVLPVEFSLSRSAVFFYLRYTYFYRKASIS